MSDGKILGGLVLTGFLGLGGMIAAFSSAYIVDEGRVAVITNMGKAERQEKPAGLQFKTPFVVGVREFDVRERAITGTLSAATSNQLVTNMTYSVNWRPDPDQIMAIFINYGSPEEFATNTIIPRLNQSLKSVVGKFSGSQLTREREAVASQMLAEAQRVLSSYPAIINSVQIENFDLPARYMEAVLAKEEQRQETEKEQLRLEQQNISAQQKVQTAKADAEATRVAAEADAYRVETAAKSEAAAIRELGDAQAAAIEAQGKALAGNPLLVELRRVEAWDGTLPVTVMGDQPELLMQMPN